jgi:tRNA-dihydrouridine synthase 1
MAKTTVTAATKKKRKRSSSKTDATAAKEASVEKASVEKALVDRRSPSILAVAGKNRPLTFPHRYIMAPMVGASELAFRLLCRQYGTQCAYTPMMSAHKFATDAAYRAEEFQTCVADFPLVCHFESNNPQDFAAAARAAAPYCDAIDLNLGWYVLFPTTPPHTIFSHPPHPFTP